MRVARTNRAPALMRLLACTLALTMTHAALATAALVADKQASIVVDGNTGAVLHAQDADEPRYPASLTKMMTLYMAFEEIKAGRMSESTMLTVSVNAASMAPSKIGLEVGERISLGNAMKAVVTKSANDMACAIAEAIAGTEAEFARRMTRRARDIGMTSTTFRNASGLPDPRQLTTARDMVTLGLRLRDDHPEQFALFRLRSFSYGGKTYKSHNTLLNGFGGMDGIKTGYTRASGFNLVSSVQRDGKYVVGAVFGGVSASVRNAHMRVILFHSLAKASTEKTRKAAPVLIARQKPAKPPKPQVVAQAPKKTVTPEKSADKPVAQAAAAPAAQQGQADPTIKIAKVKAVLVATQTSTPAAVAPPAAVPPQQPQFVTASAMPRLDLGARSATAGSQPATEPVRAPGTLDSQSSALTKPAATAPTTVAAATDTGAQQARAILSAPAARAAAPASSAGGYLIQVGAFASAAEAERHLDVVRGRAATLLKDCRASAEQAKVGSRQAYRARFAEFDSAAANAACTTLRQQKVDCMVLKRQ